MKRGPKVIHIKILKRGGNRHQWNLLGPLGEFIESGIEFGPQRVARVAASEARRRHLEAHPAA